MIDDGFLHALVDDFGKMDKYWEGMAREFPLHPMAANRSRWKSTIGCTLYCGLDSIGGWLQSFLFPSNIAIYREGWWNFALSFR